MAQNNLNTNNLNVNNSTGDFDDQNLFNLDELVDRWVSPPGHLELPELSDEAKLRDQERYDKFRQEIEKSFDSITSEKPRWGEAHPSTDHSLSPGIYNGLKTYENAITVEEEDSRIILPNGRSIVVYDENNPASIWRAYRELSRPLARATSRKFGDFVRAEGSGALPEYCDEPDQILETNFIGLPQITAPQLKVGTAALVATAVLLSGATEASALDKTRTSAIVLNDTLSKKVEQTRQRPTTEVLNRQPQASEIHKVDLVYTPTRATHLRAVANDLKVPVKVLQEANPELSSTKEIPAGTKILGQAQSSVVELLRPVPVAELANNYGLTTDALKSVNQVSDDNQLSPGAVYIPGRLLIYTDLSVGDMNLELLAKSLQMSTTGTKELLRINKHAIDGIVAIPLVNLPQSEQLPSAQYVALAVQAPVLALEAPSNDASVAEVSTPTTTSTESPSTEAPVVNSTPAIAPGVPTDGVIQEPEVATPEAPAEPVAEIPAETIPATLVDVFASQRDNPNMGSRPNGKSINSSNTCNITSLTMALQQIDLLKDVPVDAQPEQVVVFKYLSELAKQGKDITDPFALQKLAEQFGAKGDVREVKNNILFWIDLNNRLLNGESAIMSISGHIVHVKEMNMLGIVVDDPAGSSVLLHKVNGRWISSSDPSVTDSSGKPWYEFKELNSKTPDTANQPGQPGDNHIWPWSDVASYQHFNWVLTMSNPNPSPTPAPVEVVPAPEQSSSPNVDSVSPAVDAPAAETSVEADSESTQVEIDYRALANMQRQILPTTAGIPEEIRTLISPSEHFNAIQIAAQIKNESNFNPGAKSGAGAVGISQFMRGTWEDVARRYPEKTNPTATRTDPSESIIRQGLYMDELYEQVLEYLAKGRIQGDPVDLTLAAYNAGMGNVLKAHGVPNFTETKNYIKRIKQTTAEYVLLVASENS